MYSVIYIESFKVMETEEEKILSIAFFRYENNEITDELMSIINPEVSIPEVFEKRINLSNKRLQKAPKFYQVAKRVLEIIENTMIVCFDEASQFSLLKKEFETLGFPLNLTVFDIKKEIEKHTFPLKEITLPEIYKAFGIPFLKDFSNKSNGLALVKLFKIIQEKDIEKCLNQQKEIFSSVENNLFKIQRDLPYEKGIFYIHNQKGTIIFLEKTQNIRNRVNQIFTSQDIFSKSIQNQVDYVTFDLITSDLIASIKEQIGVKHINPVFNKKIDFKYEKETLFDPKKSFLIIDKGRVSGENSFASIQKGRITGYGYYELNNQINTKAQIEKRIIKIKETKEIRALVQSCIKQKKYIKIIDL